MREPPEGLSPEQREQVEQAMAQARAAFGNVSRVGCLGLLFRGIFGSPFRRLRRGRRKLVYLVIGLLVVVASITTCSAGVDLASLTAEYGDPVPTSTDAARRFVERTAAAVQSAAASRRLSISVSESEATSALSLGLMMPELMRAMETMPAEEIQQAKDIEEVRELIREHEAVEPGSRTLGQRVAALLDPRLRTGDVQVRFTGNGEIVIAGYVHAWRWRQPALVVFAPSARAGELQLDFVKGRLGRLPAPAWAFDLLGNLVTSLILMGQDYAEISNLTVTEGRLTFEATVTG
jgi:hypothetical protein